MELGRISSAPLSPLLVGSALAAVGVPLSFGFVSPLDPSRAPPLPAPLVCLVGAAILLLDVPALALPSGMPGFCPEGDVSLVGAVFLAGAMFAGAVAAALECVVVFVGAVLVGGVLDFVVAVG